MPTKFEKLEAQISKIKKLPQNPDASGFFIQEILRFYSISATLRNSGYKLDETATVDERYLTHTLLRSLLENFFTIIYLFDDPAQTATRYDSLTNSFKSDYTKLMNDLGQPQWQTFMQSHQSALETADPSWTLSPKLLNVNSMLQQLNNNYGDRLDYLYPLYRITSFDTHGRSLGIVFESVFSKTSNFPILKVRKAFELIADQYLATLKDLQVNGSITYPN